MGLTIISIFTPQKWKIVTTNWIYDKTPYVQLPILPKPWKLYTISDGVDGDIFQVCLSYPSILHLSYILRSILIIIMIIINGVCDNVCSINWPVTHG